MRSRGKDTAEDWTGQRLVDEAVDGGITRTPRAEQEWWSVCFPWYDCAASKQFQALSTHLPFDALSENTKSFEGGKRIRKTGWAVAGGILYVVLRLASHGIRCIYHRHYGPFQCQVGPGGYTRNTGTWRGLGVANLSLAVLFFVSGCLLWFRLSPLCMRPFDP